MTDAGRGVGAIVGVAMVLLVTLTAGVGMFGTVAAAGNAADVDPGDLPGAGTEQDPYLITNASELQAMAGDLDAHYALGADVDASDTATWNDGDGFDPVGEDDDPFTGSFDGRGHEISGLTIDRTQPDYSYRPFGLFGHVDGVTISDVRVVDADVTVRSIQSPGGVGILVGVYEGDVTVTKVHTSGTLDAEDGEVGGILGAPNMTYGEGTTLDLSLASADVTIERANEAGGLVGSFRTGRGEFTESRITKAFATGEITGATYDAGGLVGFSTNSRIENAWAAVDVAEPSEGTSSGGLAGSGRGLQINDSYWDQSVSGHDEAIGDDGQIDNVTGLDTSAMQGEAARTNMSRLDFDRVWGTRSAEYPTFYYRLGNTPPQPQDDSYTSAVNGTLSVEAPGVLANDADPDGNHLTASLVAGPSSGSLDLRPNGSFVYEPEPGFEGQVTFTYAASDGAYSRQANVTIDVSATNLRSISYGETKPGELDESDPTGYRGYYEPVTFEGSAGDVVDIEMLADAGDTYLILLGPNGEEVARDDDSSPEGSWNALIEGELPENGTYTIVATSLSSSETFEYSLSLDLVGQADEWIDLRSISDGQTRSGEIDPDDPVEEGIPYEPVEFSASSGQNATIEMSAAGNWPPTVVLVAPNGSIVTGEQAVERSTVVLEDVPLDATGNYTVWAVGMPSEPEEPEEPVQPEETREAVQAEGVTLEYTLSLSLEGGYLTIPEAVAQYDANNATINDVEILWAIELWRDDLEVPLTGGKTIDDTTMLQLIDMWRTEAEV